MITLPPGKAEEWARLTLCALVRYPTTGELLRVLAPELGVEGAWTVDFSLSGIQVCSAQPLEPGSLVRLHLYPSDSGCSSLLMNACVALCRSHPQEGCRSGLEFRDQPVYLKKELRLLHDQLSKRTA